MFQSNREGRLNLYQIPASGIGDEKLLVGNASYPSDFSPDGRFLVYRTHDAQTKYDIWALALQGDVKPSPWSERTAMNAFGVLLPNAKELYLLRMIALFAPGEFSSRLVLEIENNFPQD